MQSILYCNSGYPKLTQSRQSLKKVTKKFVLVSKIFVSNSFVLWIVCAMNFNYFNYNAIFALHSCATETFAELETFKTENLNLGITGSIWKLQCSFKFKANHFQALHNFKISHLLWKMRTISYFYCFHISKFSSVKNFWKTTEGAEGTSRLPNRENWRLLFLLFDPESFLLCQFLQFPYFPYFHEIKDRNIESISL